jgi:DNA-binding beta-propeller fold protein YncE
MKKHSKIHSFISLSLATMMILFFVTIRASISEVDVIGILSEKAHFKYPRSLFVDLDAKKLIVADTGNGQIKILNTEGEFISSFGDGMSIYPTKVIKDSGSRYIICDPLSGEISFFDRRGKFLDNMHFSDNPDCGVIKPVSLAYNSKGEMLVLDQATCQVKIFASSGVFLYSIGREGSRDGELANPTDLTVDENDNVYVVDNGNDRVSVFNRVGNFIRTIGDGILSSPSCVGISGNSVYVSDTGNSKIRVFSPKGKLLKTIGEHGIGSSQFRYPTGFVIDANGILWVADTGNNRILKLDGNKQLYSIGLKGVSLWPKGITTTNGHIYVSESSSDFVNVYSAETGEHIQSIGSQGTESTNLKNPEDCDISTRDDLVVADTGNNRIQIYSLFGDHLFGFGEEGSGAGQFRVPRGIGIDKKTGNIFVADTGNSRVASVSMSGTWVFSFDDELSAPVDVAIDSQDRIWVVDEDLGEVLIFDPQGKFIESLAGVAFTKPSSITIDGFGRVFICDAGVSDIRVFSESGFELGSYGEFGGPLSSLESLSQNDNLELLNQPSGITISGLSVFISDTANSRILKVPLSNFGGLPKLFVDTDEIIFEKVPLSTKRSRIIHLMNTGSGTIFGKITTDTDWIEVVPSEFNGEVEVTVWAVGENAKEGQREGKISIICNGGIQIIPVTSKFFDGKVKRIIMRQGHNNVEANGKTINVYPAPHIDPNYYRYYVYFRFIVEELGGTAYYDRDEKKIDYYLDGKKLRLIIDEKIAYLDGEKIEAYSPTYLFKDRYPIVPLRFVVESLGGSIILEGDKIIAEYP